MMAQVEMENTPVDGVSQEQDFPVLEDVPDNDHDVSVTITKAELLAAVLEDEDQVEQHIADAAAEKEEEETVIVSSSEKVEEENDEDYEDVEEGEGSLDNDEEEDDDISNETVFERITALKDVIPPVVRYQVSQTVMSTASTTFSVLHTLGYAGWVLATASLMVFVPVALELERESFVFQQEAQQRMQQEKAQEITQQQAQTA